jgi:hypothetical protein
MQTLAPFAGFKHLADAIHSVKFENGVHTDTEESSRIAA